MVDVLKQNKMTHGGLGKREGVRGRETESLVDAALRDGDMKLHQDTTS